MNKLSLILFILFIAISTRAFPQSDFRDVKWGMSLEQVKSIETAPLSTQKKDVSGSDGSKTFYDGYELTYEGVTVAGKNSDLYYHFDNGKLTSIRIVFRHGLYTNYNTSLSTTINGFSSLLEVLHNKGFRFSSPLQCGNSAYDGPDYNNPDNSKIQSMKNWSISPEILRLNEKMISEKHYKASFFRIENTRSQGLVEFETEYSELKSVSPIIMEFKPSYEIQKAINKSDF